MLKLPSDQVRKKEEMAAEGDKSTFKLNPHTKEFIPQQRSYPPLSTTTTSFPIDLTINSEVKSSFRDSKANRYRQLIMGQCKEKKEEILEKIRVGDKFWCYLCNLYNDLNYARLDHEIPLKKLWLDFENENKIEMNLEDSAWSSNGPMTWAWKNFHQKNAKLRVICKDCEKASQISL